MIESLSGLPTVRQVFLSYAHDDDLAPSQDHVGWVTFFDRTLDVELSAQGLKNRVRIWRDTRGMRPMDYVDETLKKDIVNSDMLIAVLSPPYVAATYCKMEREEFVCCSKSLRRASESGLILVVVKYPLDSDDEWPLELKNILYVPFFEIDRVKRIPKPFYDGYGKAVRVEYWDAMRDVAYAIKRTVDKLDSADTDGSSQVEPAAAGTEESPRAVVFLAQPTEDVDEQYRIVHRELRSLNCRVVPDGALPATAADAEAALRAALAEADLAIHLLGGSAGFTPEGAEVSIVRLQLDLAAARMDEAPSFRRFIWCAPHITRAEDAQQQFLNGLAARLKDKDELIKKPLQVFLDAVRDSLPPLAGRPARVFLLYEPADENDGALDRLSDAIAARGHEVRPISHDAGGDDYNHQQLLSCDAALVFWGTATPDTIEGRLDQIAPDPGREQPFRARGLVLGAPITGLKRRFRSPRVDLILQLGDDAAVTLEPFLARLGPRGHRA